MEADRKQQEPLEPGPQLHAGMFRERTAEELLQVRNDLRLAQADDDTPEALAALRETMEDLFDFCVDREIIAHSGIGKEVASLKKHKDAVVAQRAAALIAEWKRDMSIRDKVVDGFMEKGSLKKRDAKDLEEGLFNFACPLGLLVGDGYKSYQQHYKRLCTHLRDRGSGCLLERLQANTLACKDVAMLDDVELRSVEQQNLRDEAAKEGLKAAIGSTEESTGIESTEYSCPKCRSARCEYKELQTGWHNDQQDLTILVRCLDCGERWKASDDHGLGGS